MPASNSTAVGSRDSRGAAALPGRQALAGVRSIEVRWAWLWLIFSSLAVYPALAHNIAALAYDAATAHVYRGVAFSQVISDGVLYPRWSQFLHLGLGSPMFTFQGPLPYYAMDLLYRLGISHPVGWSILMGLGLLAASLGAYLLVRALTGQHWPALVAAVAYLYAPYVLRNALERGSNEAYSMFLYPWVLWSLVALARRPGRGRFVVAALLWAICIGCHVLAPLMLAPFAALAALWLAWRYRTAWPVLALLAGGFLMAAVWLPMVPEQNWIQLERDFIQAQYTSPARHPIPVERLLAPPALYDTRLDNNGSGDRVGLLHMALLALGLPGAWWARRQGRRELSFYLVAAAAAGLGLFWLLTRYADPLWLWLEPLLTRLEFRSRWMGIQALMAAGTAGLLLALLPARRQRLAGLALVGLFVAAALPSLYVELQHRYAPFGRTLSLAEVREAEIRVGGTAFSSFFEFMPAGRQVPVSDVLKREVGPDFDPQTYPLAAPPAGLQVLSSRVRSSSWDLSLRAPQAQTITLHVLHYPRWRAYVDDRPVPVSRQPDTGYLQLELPQGEHRVALRYGSTWAEDAGLGLSGLTALVLLGLLAQAALPRARTRAATARALLSQLPTSSAPSLWPESGEAPRSAPSTGAPAPIWLLAALSGLVLLKLAYVDPATTWLRCVSKPGYTCGAQASADIPFPGAPRLAGYTVRSQAVRRGGEVKVDLYWRSEPVMHGLNSFVHIRNSTPGGPVNPRDGSDIWAQGNHPTPGGFSVTDYAPGRLYLDEHVVQLPADMPPGRYFVEIGWFDPVSGEQIDPQAEAVQPPLKVLWRSILLPSVEVQP